MTITTDAHIEAELIERTLLAEETIRKAQTELTILTSERRDLRASRQRARFDQTKAALIEAEQKHAALGDQHTAAKAALTALNKRLDDGDDSVTTEALRTAELDVDRAKRLMKSAEKPLAEARAAHRINTSDDLLADRAVEIIRSSGKALGVVSADVFTEKHPAIDPPVVEPAIVISQTAPTGDKGDVVKNGTIKMTTYGIEIDPQTLVDVFAEHDCELHVTGDTLTFRRAVWPVPLIAEPDLRTFQRWSNEVCKVWKSEVFDIKIGNGSFGQAKLHNVSAHPVPGSIEVTTPGKAVAEVTIEAEAEGACTDAQALTAMLRTVAAMEGLDTNFGLVESVSVAQTIVPVQRNQIYLGQTFEAAIQSGRHSSAEAAWRFDLTLDLTFLPLEV